MDSINTNYCKIRIFSSYCYAYYYCAPVREQSIVLSTCVCLTIRLFARMSWKPQSKLQQTFCTYWLRPSLYPSVATLQCVMYNTSGFVDDVMFAHNRPNKRNAKGLMLPSDRPWVSTHGEYLK